MSSAMLRSCVGKPVTLGRTQHAGSAIRAFRPQPMRLARRVSHVMRAGSSQAAEETKNRAYANALMELAKEEDNVEKVKEDFEDFSKYVQMHTGVANIFTDESGETGDDDERLRLLSDVCSLHKYSKEFSNFVGLLLQHRRFDNIPDICDIFCEEIESVSATKVCTITSATELPEETLYVLAAMVQTASPAAQIKVRTEVNPDLIAGFTVKFDTLTTDMSLRGSLYRLAKKTLDGDDLDAANELVEIEEESEPEPEPVAA